MNKYDMSDYLSMITECCVSVTSTWDEDVILDTSKISEIRKKVQGFIYDHKSEVMEMYDFAERAGKYKIITIPDVYTVIEKFETYFQDLGKFLNDMVGMDCEKEISQDEVETITRAANADKKFFDNSFSEENEIQRIRISFPEALSKIEVLLRFDLLIGEIEDMYIHLNHLNLSSDRMKMLVDLYASSTMRFLVAMSKELLVYVSALIDGKNGVVDKTITGSYKLI